MKTRAALLKEAESFFSQKRYPQALLRYYRYLGATPEDLSVCLSVADVLREAGEVRLAREVYAALTRRSLRRGFPWLGLFALSRLVEEADGRAEALANEAASLYAAGTRRLNRSVPTLSLPPMEEKIPLEEEPPLAELARMTAERAAGPKEVELAQTLPEVGLLSLFSPDLFATAALGLKTRIVAPGELLIREGEKGGSVYLVASGRLTAFRRTPAGGEEERGVREMGASIGEMALVSLSPRTASVRADIPSRVLEISRDLLKVLYRKSPEVGGAIKRFAREQLLRKLLATSPFFVRFPKKQRLALIRHFTGHDIAANTNIITEGEEGKGLYLILSGSVEVYKGKGPDKISLATLQGGDAFGEISLLYKRPTSATVTAREPTQLLFLSRDIFQKLMESTPELREYFERLSQDRARAIEQALASSSEEPMLFDDEEVTQELALDDITLM